MKKIIMITVVLVFALSAMAFAGGSDVSTYANPLFHSSSHVKVFAFASTSAFAAQSKHQNGTRTYGTASDSTNIAYNETTLAGKDIEDGPSASDSSAFASGWSSL